MPTSPRHTYNVFINTYFKNEDVDRWIFSCHDLKIIKWDDIDKVFDSNNLDEKISFLSELYNNDNKNRFCNN